MSVDTWEDEDVRGLTFDFESEIVQTIYGATEFRFGPKIEPDEHLCQYTVLKVRLYDVEIDIDNLGIEEFYKDECDMAEDVVEKVCLAIKQHLG